MGEGRHGNRQDIDTRQKIIEIVGAEGRDAMRGRRRFGAHLVDVENADEIDICLLVLVGVIAAENPGAGHACSQSVGHHVPHPLENAAV